MGNSRFEIDNGDDSVQSLAPPHESQRFEGIAFSSSGNIIGVATSDTNTVFLFRRNGSGQFEDRPYWSISAAESGLSYPHDLSFALAGETELLAVAQRGGAIAIFERNGPDESYGPNPFFEIRGPDAKLDFSDGVAFVPPASDCVAACNLRAGSVSFYRKVSRSPIAFEMEPVFDLRHPSLSDPDGLAFSRCGKWLAVANHGNHSIVCFNAVTVRSPRRGEIWAMASDDNKRPQITSSTLSSV